MKLLLSFVLCFNFVPVNERNVLEYILSVYSEELTNSPSSKAKGKGKMKAKETPKYNSQNIGLRLKTIFDILQSHLISPFSSVHDINPSIKEEIAKVLEINKDLDEIFIIDETLTQQKGVIHYQLFGQKFQILIQYSGHLAKLYFNNMMKCVKCYIQDGKAWVVFVMRHDFGNINEGNIKDKLDNEVFITLEYNDKLEDKRMRENDNKYDGYLYPRRSEVNTLFAIEIEQVKLFKDRLPSAKYKRDAISEEKEMVFDIWDIPENASILSGILDARKKTKVINLIQTWHKEMTQNTVAPMIEVQTEIQDEHTVETQYEKNLTEKAKKSKVDTKQIENDTRFQLEIKMKAANLLAESAWFFASNPESLYFGVLLRSKDTLTPDLVSQLRPINLNLGSLNNLPIDLLTKYGVKRIYTLVEFEHPLTNLQTIPQNVSKNMDLNFFKMIFFDDIVNYQRFFAAFHLKHMIIQLIGEIEKKKKKEEPPPVEEIPEIIEMPPEEEKGKTKIKNKKSRKKSKKEKKNESEKDTNAIEPNTDTKDVETNVHFEEKNLPVDEHIPEEEPETAPPPDNIVVSENDNVILIRICLFRIDVNRLIKLNHFHRIKETVTPSAVFDKEPLTNTLLNENAALEETETEVNYPMVMNLPRSKTKGNSKISASKTIKSNNSDRKDRSKQRCYLIGIDYEQSFTLEFDLHIQCCLKSLSKELYTAGPNGLNNIFALFEDKMKMREMVLDIQNYNDEVLLYRSDSSSAVRPVITGFALEFSDVGIMFTEAVIEPSFPLLLQWMLEVRDSLQKIIYNTSLIIPDQIYGDFLEEHYGLFTHSNPRTFKNAFRRKTAPKEIYVHLCELLHVRSIEDIHKYQLLPDCSELESLKTQII